MITLTNAPQTANFNIEDGIPYAVLETSLNGTVCCIRRIMPSKNGNNEQATVQFVQLIEMPASASNNPLLNFSQDPNRIGMGIVTALMSFSVKVLQTRGVAGFQDFSAGLVPFAAQLFDGQEVNIEVTESFLPNYKAQNQEPKINPTTGQVIKVGGKPVYRHTELVLGAPNHQFVTKVEDVKRNFPTHSNLSVEEMESASPNTRGASAFKVSDFDANAAF